MALLVASQPPPVINSNIASNSICVGSSITFTALPSGAPNYQFSVDGTPNAVSTSNIFTTNSLSLGNHLINVNIFDANGCSEVSTNLSVLVNPIPITPTINIISGSASFCDNGGGNAVTLESSIIGSGYQWFSNTIPIGGANNQALVLNTSSQSGDYQVQVIGPGPTNCASALSLKQTITINTPPATPGILISSGSSTFCDDGGTTFVTLKSSVAAASYQWYLNGSAIAGKVLQTIILTSSAQSGDYQVQAVGVSPTNCASGLSVKQTIVINPIPGTPVISVISGTSSFCDNGGSNSVTLQSNAIGSSYQWYVGGVPIVGQTNQSIVLNTSSQSGSYTVKAIGVSPTNCISPSSAAQVITINTPPATPGILISSGSSTFCDDGGTTFVTLKSSVAAASYQWYLNGSAIAGKVLQTIILTSSAQSGDYQVQAVGVSPTNCASGLSVKQTITINPIPGTPVISVISGTSSFCDNGGSNSVTLQSNAIGSSYQWYVGGVPIVGQTNQSIVLNTSSQSGSYTVKAIGVSPTNCISPSSAVQAITINTPPATPGILISSGSSTFCDDGGTTFVTLKSSVAAASYQWYLNGSAIAGKVLQTIILTSSAQSGDYQVQAVGVSPTNCASGLSVKQTIVINPIPGTPVISVISGTSSFCDNGGSNSVTLQSNAIGSSYQWYVGGVPIVGQTNQSIVLNTSSQSGSYTVKAIGVSPTNCISPSSAAQVITINTPPATPGILISSGSSTFCDDGGTTFVTLKSSVAAASYQWYLNGSAIAGKVLQTIILTSSAQSGDYQVQAVGVSPTNCASGLSVKQTITINPIPGTPVISVISGTSSFCDNGGSNSVTLQSNAIGSSYQWYVGGVPIVGQTNQSIVLNTSSQSGSYTVKAIGVSPTNCISPSSAAQAITINTPPATPGILISSGSSTFCDDGGTTFVTLKSSVAAASYQWYLNGSAIAGKVLQTIILTSSAQSGDYQVQAVGVSPTNCASGLSAIKKILIYPKINNVTTSAQNPTICSGSSTNIIVTGSQSGINYQLYIGASPYGSIVAGTGSNINLLTGFLSSTTSFNIKATNPVNLCSLNLTPQMVTVSPAVTITASSSAPYVCDGSAINLNATTTGPVSTVTWSGGGGTFSFPNSLNTTYNSLPGESGTTIVFTITTNDPDGAGPCTFASSQVSVQIKAMPSVILSGLNSSYCIDAASSNLTGFPTGGIFSGSGISGNSFSPAGLNGSVVITYSYTDIYGCSNSTSMSTIVNPLPTVSYTGLFSSYQLNAPPSILTGTPAGGNFTGAGIVGNMFNPAFAGIGPHTIRYTYQDVNGCINYQDQFTTVQPAPIVDFTGLPPITCIDHTPSYILIGSPSGGVFTGPGISGNTFDPNGAGVGIAFITYTYTIGGVPNPITKQVDVKDKPVVGFSGLASPYCVTSSPSTLVGIPSGGVFSGPGVSGNKFFPSVAGQGTFTIQYTYTDVNLCSNTSSQFVTVNPLPIVSFYNLSAQYCLNATSSVLTGNPIGGTFSGNGISGNSFFPNVAGVGNSKITYTYTDANGCTNHQDQFVKVSPLPKANFIVNNICNSKIAGFTDKSTVDQTFGDTIKTWRWSFGDGVISNVQNPSHQYSLPGVYNVKLTVTTNNSCSDTTTIVVGIGTIPIVNFTWDNLCESSSTAFTDSTYFPSGGPTGLIASWSWDFGDKSTGVNNKSNSQNPLHVFSGYGIYYVKLKVIAKSGCTDSLTQRVYILPSKVVTPNQSYFENFNSGTGGWVQDSKSKDSTAWSWKYGNPMKAHINLPSGDNAWVTGLDTTYKNKEQSYVYSPCFDISTLEKPLISLKIFTDTQSGFDGAVLQASDNGASWVKVGQKNGGINWYNQSLISSNPGTQSVIESAQGWSIENQGWVEAKYDLNAFFRSKNLRFRIAFGSNGDNPPGVILDGFAFDNVFIGERDRVVLLEHFTNSFQASSLTENLFINNKVETSNNEIIDIQYHTNFPLPDSLYDNNPNDQSARALFYSVPETPKTIIDGKYQNNLLSKDSTYLKTRELTAPLFKIGIKFPVSPKDSFTVRAVFTPKVNLINDSSIVQIAIVEKQVLINGVVYKNVLRKLLPNAAGTNL